MSINLLFEPQVIRYIIIALSIIVLFSFAYLLIATKKKKLKIYDKVLFENSVAIVVAISKENCTIFLSKDKKTINVKINNLVGLNKITRYY